MATNENEVVLQSSAHVDARDFRIEAIQLISASGIAMDITKLVVEIQVRQDMYLGFLSGEMMIMDGIDVHSQLGLHGEEYIFLHLKVPEQDLKLKKAFRIYKVANRENNSQQSSQRYLVYFTSDEMYHAQRINISKAYRSTTLAEIAKDVLINYLNVAENRIFISTQDTRQLSIIVGNWKPSYTLNWLASRGVGSPHFFFETFEGFHWKSLKAIYAEGTKIKVPFFFENKRGNKDLDMDKFAIDSVEARRDFDIISTISSGGHGISLTTIDPITQSVVTNDYDLSDISTLYKNPVMTGKTDPKSHLLTYLNTSNIDQWITRNMHLSVLNNSLIEIVIPGNMGAQIGSLINLRLPYVLPPADGDQWDDVKTGKYLVVAANHKFDLTAHKYTTLLMLARDSVPKSLPMADSKLVERVRGMV